MGAYLKNPNIDADSALLAEEAKGVWEKTTSAASKVISDSLVHAADRLVSLIDSEDLQIQYKAAAHLLKLGGLEVDLSRSESKINIEISSKQADKVEKAASILGGVE